MVRQVVKSSNLKSIGWASVPYVDAIAESTDRAAGIHARVTLEVEFQNGSIYQYADVPIGVVEQIITAPSVGAMFIVQIRQRGYVVTKIAGPTPRPTTADGLGEIVV